MSIHIKEQFIRDMQVAGFAKSTQRTYLQYTSSFFRDCWVSAEDATEQDIQAYLISLRERDMAQVTFRVTRHALEFLFSNTLGRDWPLFKKN